MNTRPDLDLWPWLTVIATFAGAFTLGCFLIAAAPIETPEGGGVTDLLFGSSRQALSADLYEEADTFFHRGVPHHARHVAMDTWIERLHDVISPEEHRHAEGQASAEIIPWLKLATEADPHNIDAWLVSAYWLETGLDRADLAEQTLREAQRHNPGDYCVLLDRARLCIRTGRFETAGNVLDAALSRWPGGLDPNDRQSLLDKAELLCDRGFLDEMAGHTNAAVTAFKNMLAIFPERTYIEKRMHVLEAGGQPAESARALLEQRVKRSAHDAGAEEFEEHDQHDK